MSEGDHQTILASVRENLEASRPADSESGGRSEVAPPFRPPSTDADRKAFVEQFTRELTAVGAGVMSARTAYGVQGYTRDVIHRHRAQRIAISASPVLESYAVGPLLQQAGRDVISLPTRGQPAELEEYKRQLMEADLGITGADFGLADSGTLVMQTSHAEGRLASLLPPVHLAVIKTSQILPSVVELINQFERPPRGSDLIFITGPSRTADIELTLTVGVHGPKVLYVLLVE